VHRGGGADGETHLVLIPSYNTGTKLLETVAEARRYWSNVCVVIDGSTDCSGDTLLEWNRERETVCILRRAANGGKGAAVLDGLHAAAAEGFTHALVMDADGQHPAAMIPNFMVRSKDNRDAMILGVPVFDHEAPRARVMGRRVSNGFTSFETSGAIGDSLFGFRVYPIAPLIAVMNESRWMRRFDFDVEAAVRLCWRGVRAINAPAPVRYFRRGEGGVSHFRYGRDNLLLAAMHARLMMTCLLRRVKSSHH
jgi:glycosyltransferase involved in cell wall biosynthesis